MSQIRLLNRGGTAIGFPGCCWVLWRGEQLGESWSVERRQVTNPIDATARVALEFQAQQLRMINERLSYVRAMLPNESVDWRGPAQELFDASVRELHRDCARARTLIDAAEQRTMAALGLMSSRVG